MKVTITGKGEGYVLAHMEAESPIEAMLLSVCTLESTETALELKTESDIDWSKQPPVSIKKAWLTFHGWRIKAMDMVQGVSRG